MTVKEIIKVIKNARSISIGFGDRAIAINQDDALMIDVYGDYVVDAITIDEARDCELNVAMMPVKERSNVT